MLATATSARRYHVGLRAHDARGNPCPFHQLILNGVNFHRFTERVTYNDETRASRRDKVQGGYVTLTEEQVARIKHELDHIKRFAWLNKRKTAAREVHLYDQDVVVPVMARLEGTNELIRTGERVVARAGDPVNKSLGSFPWGGLQKLHPWVYMLPAPELTPYEWSDPPSILDDAPWEDDATVPASERPARRAPRQDDQLTRDQLEGETKAALLRRLGDDPAARGLKKAELVERLLELQAGGGQQLAQGPDDDAPWADEVEDDLLSDDEDEDLDALR